MYLGGGGHHFMPATTILRKFYFSKKACKIQEILENFFCISSGNFIGLSNGISFVSVLSVIFEIFEIFYLRLICS